MTKPGTRPGRIVLFATIALMQAGVALAQRPPAAHSPAALGFQHFYKCPSDADVDRLGDTVTPDACLAACEARAGAAGCWWLDGTGGFPRECRVCRTMQPTRQSWPNDWALSLWRMTS
jgi:hypothetical protein